MNINKVTIAGRIGKEPKVYTGGNTDVLNFSVAVSSRWKNKAGERQESTEWVNCTAFGKLSEFISNNFGKGSRIYLEGKLSTSEYTLNGDKKYKTAVIIDKVEVIDWKSGSDVAQEPQKTVQQEMSANNDLPF